MSEQAQQNHPYSRLPNHCFWRQSMSDVGVNAIDPVINTDLIISSNHKVATAGSCFAQHISRHLAKHGMPPLVTETAHPLIPARLRESYGYGVFTARYGNIYTPRQLVQLFDRSHGGFQPSDDAWPSSNQRVIDPYRPRIQPNGFSCINEFHADRQQHFAAVRKAFESLDILIFTLGLTECWMNKNDGAIYPLCPGVSGGEFKSAIHTFINFGVTETVNDIMLFVDKLHSVNAKAKVLLTVSPVPLNATAEPRHVLTSTIYSKSVLRVACDVVVKQRTNVSYFPSYEIITGPHAGNRYFDSTLRNVTELGISHVMRVFLRHYTNPNSLPALNPESQLKTECDRMHQSHTTNVEAAIKAMCDEEALSRPPTEQPVNPAKQ